MPVDWSEEGMNVEEETVLQLLEIEMKALVGLEALPNRRNLSLRGLILISGSVDGEYSVEPLDGWTLA